LIGPWKHELPDRAVNRPIGFTHEMARWFEHWLKGHDTGIMDEPPVIVYAQPDGWRSAARWPPAERRQVCFYLHPDGRLGPDALPDGGADSYRVDPSVGLHHLPWDWTTPATTAAANISPDDHRALTYATTSLRADLVIDGRPELVVHVSADQPDFPLAAWLSDVSPNGFSTLICQGWIRPAHALSAPLEAGRPYELRLSLFPTAYRVPRGHGLRLAISGAHFPVLLPAPVSPTLMLHRSGGRPSRLLLPIGEACGWRGDAPAFQGPLGENLEALVLRESDHVLARDLSGRKAAHRSQHREVHRLEGGTTLRTEMETSASIDVDAPRDVRPPGTRTLVVDGAQHAVVVRTGVTETFEHCHLTAQITLDGREFFDRSWDLDLRHSEWSMREAANAVEPRRMPRP
jgi:hypothetical protein